VQPRRTWCRRCSCACSSTDRPSGRAPSSRPGCGRSPATPRPTSGAAATLERQEQFDRLAGALDRLAPQKRELLLLARFSELGYDRIGELLGISVGAVKVRVHRALQELKTAYLAEAGEGAA
jgi:RNA polymerase sigma factor (sigma-70 family)